MVRKFFIGAFAIMAFAATVVLMPANTEAEMMSPAAVFTDVGCFVGPGLAGTLLLDFDNRSVVTSSGNTVLNCKFTYPPGTEPAATINVKGFLCGTFLGFTTQSHFVGTKSGQASLMCRINGSS